jgi:hypothetical protein
MDRDDRWIHVAAYASLRYGQALAKKATEEEVRSCLSEYSASNPGAKVEASNPEHQSLVLGLSCLLPKSPFSIEQMLSFTQEVKKHCDQHPNPQVRIRQDIWKNTFEGGAAKHRLSFKDFAVLCAIYAAIGNKSYAKVSHDYIRCLASGHSDFREFAAGKSEPFKDSLQLSKRQVRKIIDVLEANAFFSKFTYNRGECFYSNRLKRHVLSARISARKLRKPQTVAIHRSLDQADSLDIKKRIREASAPYRHMRKFSRADFVPAESIFTAKTVMPVAITPKAAPKQPGKQSQEQADSKTGQKPGQKASAPFPKQKPAQEPKPDDPIPGDSGFFMNLLKAEFSQATTVPPKRQSTQQAA